MFSFLKNHPFAVEAFFESSVVLTFAAPKDQIQHLVPECLKLDDLNNEFAFIAVAMVQTRNLRPKGVPSFLGNNFFLIGYRVFVKYTNAAGKRLRGLYILKSETDKRKMEFFGNVFTHYNYSTTDILQTRRENVLQIKSVRSGFDIEVETGNGEIALPRNSPFADWHEARKFAGPLPFTFTYDPNSKTVLIIEGVRENWNPAPLKVNSCHVSFLDTLNVPELTLANAFMVTKIPYCWKKGIMEKWNG